MNLSQYLATRCPVPTTHRVCADLGALVQERHQLAQHCRRCASYLDRRHGTQPYYYPPHTTNAYIHTPLSAPQALAPPPTCLAKHRRVGCSHRPNMLTEPLSSTRILRRGRLLLLRTLSHTLPHRRLRVKFRYRGV